MKKIIAIFALMSLAIFSIPGHIFAAGISVSGGGAKTVGQTFTASIVASGGEFNAFQGKIAVSGPLSVVSFSAGSANWITQPTANGSFSGALLGQKVTSFTIATIKLKATAVGTGSVTVSNVILKNGSATLSTSGGSATFTIQKAPELPGAVTVTSSTHPDQNVAYEATTIALAWDKGKNVTGFSYLLDQAADTNPPSKVTDANLAASYEGKAVGTYYFHIKAQNPDGWSPVTHFKITIKEPDPKVNEALSKPSKIEIKKSTEYNNLIAEGTFSGFIISGITEPNFTANITLDPTVTLPPDGKTLSVKADDSGLFQLLIDFQVKSGHYKLTIQGQDGKILTPVSDPIYFEISQKKGGMINILTDDDAKEPAVVQAKEQVKKWYEDLDFRLASMILTGIVVILLIVLTWMIISGRKNNGLRKIVKNLDLK